MLKNNSKNVYIYTYTLSVMALRTHSKALYESTSWRISGHLASNKLFLCPSCHGVTGKNKI